MEYNNYPTLENYNKFGMHQNRFQNKHIANQFMGRPMDQHLALPQIRNKYRDVEDQKLNLVNETLNFVQNKSKRALQGRGPFTNYPMYNPDIVNFLNNYPNSLMHYRPIRYFFQRPVQIDEHTHFPHQKQAILQNRAEYNTAVEVNRNMAKKYAKEVKYSDLINQAQELELPMAKVISAEEVNHKLDELNKVKDELFRMDPKRRKEIRNRNKKHWAFIYKLGNIINFWKIINEFKVGKKKYKAQSQLLERASNADMLDLIKFFGKIVSNSESLVLENFGAYIVFNSNNEQKNEDSTFVVKRFIHKIFQDIGTSTADVDDIDPNLRGVLLNYMLNDRYLPPWYLSTQEFNRLEWGLDWSLKKMTHERQAMVVGLMVLYKCLLLNIMMKPELYFKNYEKAKFGGTKIKTQYEHDEEGLNERQHKLQEEKEKNKKLFEKSKEEKELEKLGRRDVGNIVLNNFALIRVILHHILTDVFKLGPSIHRELLKEDYMYKFFVHKGGNDVKLALAADENEFASNITKHDQARLFIEANQRWINYMKMNAQAFALNLAVKCLTGESYRLKKEAELNNKSQEIQNRARKRNEDLYGEN